MATQTDRYTTDLYFEAHVTIEPFSEEKLPVAVDIAQRRGFRAATFLLKKGSNAVPDDFLTTRCKDYSEILNRTFDCVEELESEGFNVKRFKIENTLLDVRL